jgi:acyl-coenzyme A synthetase/AMP-(fatty) acid ligase
LCTQAGVKEAAVVALPDSKLGQRPVAYVTTTNGAVDLAALKSAIVPLVTYDLAPLTIKSVAAFPMTPTGKIAKVELRQSALAEG